MYIYIYISTTELPCAQAAGCQGRPWEAVPSRWMLGSKPPRRDGRKTWQCNDKNWGFQGFIAGWWFGTCFFSIYWEFHHPNWRTHIFQRGRYTTNQYSCKKYGGWSNCHGSWWVYHNREPVGGESKSIFSHRNGIMITNDNQKFQMGWNHQQVMGSLISKRWDFIIQSDGGSTLAQWP